MLPVCRLFAIYDWGWSERKNHFSSSLSLSTKIIYCSLLFLLNLNSFHIFHSHVWAGTEGEGRGRVTSYSILHSALLDPIKFFEQNTNQKLIISLWIKEVLQFVPHIAAKIGVWQLIFWLIRCCWLFWATQAKKSGWENTIKKRELWILLAIAKSWR